MKWVVAEFCCLFSTTFLTFQYTSLQKLASFWCAETHAGIHNYLRLSSHEMILKCSKGHTRSLRPGLGKTRIFASPTCLVAEAAVAERGNWCDWILAISFNTVRLMFLDPWMSRWKINGFILHEFFEGSRYSKNISRYVAWVELCAASLGLVSCRDEVASEPYEPSDSNWQDGCTRK